MHVLHKVLLFHVLICLGQNALGSEIIKGTKAKKKSMLYMASVQNKKGHVCGGFLVSEDFVMTAAHCVNQNPTSVVLGTHSLKNVNDDTMRYSIKKCKHPDYKAVISGNDIMLLQLSRKAHLGKKGPIKPIKIPSNQIKLKGKQKCSVAGWGATKTNGSNVDELQVVDIPVINLETCQKMWNDKLPANVVCAGGYGTKKGFCQVFFYLFTENIVYISFFFFFFFKLFKYILLIHRVILVALWCATGRWQSVLSPLTATTIVTTQMCPTSIQTYQNFFPGSKTSSRKSDAKCNKMFLNCIVNLSLCLIHCLSQIIISLSDICHQKMQMFCGKTLKYHY
ncbi:mast cell protease 3-like isoform X1 [Amphiprion ocellaris]|uniref:mast cell protease 3-like isoform X1 n=1 Tax=Amphiprion ocellaris TaxID=80972 RepID=UPI002410E2DA|nr:mast cell protease 3-like isoform X1 [Amphiprion ocellaris]